MGKPSKDDALARPEHEHEAGSGLVGESSASISLHDTNRPIPRYFDDDPAEIEPNDLPPLYSDYEQGLEGPINPLLPQGTADLVEYFRKDPTTGTEYYLDRRLSTDPKFLESQIRILAQLPPRPTVHLKGTHHETVRNGDKSERREVVDFDITVDLTYLLCSDVFKDPAWHDIRCVGNFEKVRRGTVFPTRAPGFGGSGAQQPENGTPSLEEWCHRFCASHAGLRNFAVERRVHGWDWTRLKERLVGLVRATNYRGHLVVDFPLRDARVEVYNECRTNRWRLTRWVQVLFAVTLLFVVAWPWLLLRTRRWETVYADWHLSRVVPVDDDNDNGNDEDAGVGSAGRRRRRHTRGRKINATLDEHQWYNIWARAIQRAVLARRQGKLTQGELAEGPGPEGGIEGSSRLVGLVQAGVEAMGVVDRSFGWGGDS